MTLSSQLHRKHDRPAIEDAWRRVQRDVHPMLLRAIDDLLVEDPATIGSLLAATAGHGSTIADCHAMLAHGHVRADMTTPADATMTLHHRAGDAWFDRLIPFKDPRSPRA